MRAFEPFNRKYRWNHPEDMKTIIEYLECTGKINIQKDFLEDLYYDYSDSVACGWRCVDPKSLEEFEALYFTLCIEKVVGWSDYRDIRIFNDAKYTKNYAIKKYKEYGGKL